MDARPSEFAECKQRRSHRVTLSAPITVSSEFEQGPFSEETQTLSVSAHGALISLSAPVSGDEALQIRNAHGEQQACRVVFLGRTAEGQRQIGVEFPWPSPNFWHVEFPAVDHLYLPKDQTERLEAISQRTGTPVAKLIRRAVEAYLKQLTPN